MSTDSEKADPADERRPVFNVTRIFPRPLSYLSSQLHALAQAKLWQKILIGLVAGIATGIAMGPTTGWMDPRAAAVVSDWIAFPGQLFLALIQMIVIPLIFASIVRGLAAAQDIEQLRKIGIGAGLYFVATTAVAITIGLTMAYLIEPGHFVDAATVKAGLRSSTPAVAETNGPPVKPPALDELPGFLVTLLPDNPLSSMVQAEMLQVVIFAIVFGVALAMMAPQQARPLLDLFGSLQEVCMMVVRWAMWLAPFAVFGLILRLTAKVGIEALLGIAVYVATVIAGLLVLFVFYQLIVIVLARRSPVKFIGAAREPLLLAFSTSSSAAVMPLTMRTLEEKIRVRPSVSQFIVPLGATINMDGTALYQGVAALFLIQVFGVDIGPAGMVLLVITVVGASIGTPSTPGVGIVILASILTTIGVPPSGVALIVGVDRLLDMCRTTLNVTGDMVAAMVMDRWIGGKLSARRERAAEEKRETRRVQTGEDVIVHNNMRSTQAN
jgi:Na+/H+-dicarboxylate symporter